MQGNPHPLKSLIRYIQIRSLNPLVNLRIYLSTLPCWPIYIIFYGSIHFIYVSFLQILASLNKSDTPPPHQKLRCPLKKGTIWKGKDPFPAMILEGLCFFCVWVKSTCQPTPLLKYTPPENPGLIKHWLPLFFWPWHLKKHPLALSMKQKQTWRSRQPLILKILHLCEKWLPKRGPNRTERWLLR